MFAVPPRLVPGGSPQVTGLGCPECPGTLEVQAQGTEGYLSFTCRIGHSFSAHDLLAAKESAVETHLWNAVCALEELAALLEDVTARSESEGTKEVRQRLEERLTNARRQASTLRRFTEETEPLKIEIGVASDPPGPPGPPRSPRPPRLRALMGINLERLPRSVITVGTSAGGYEALTQLFSRLPGDLPATVLAVIHRSPIFVSNMAPGLGRRSEMPVSEVRDGDPVTPGRVYVAPPDHHVIVERNRLRLRRSPKVHFTRPAVDPLFASAAAAYGRRVVGVLLTGGGEDGVSGLIAIKAAGGMTIVQHPGEAPFPTMPTSAIINDHVDAILPLDRIAETIIKLAAGEAIEEFVPTPGP